MESEDATQREKSAEERIEAEDRGVKHAQWMSMFGISQEQVAQQQRAEGTAKEEEALSQQAAQQLELQRDGWQTVLSNTCSNAIPPTSHKINVSRG